MLNKVILMGRLTRDPELRRTQKGTPVASFTLAVQRDHAGEGKEPATDFIDFAAWRGTGEFVARNFTKGQMAVVVGRMETRNWVDDDGQNRKSVYINCDNVYFGEPKKKEKEQEDYANASYQSEVTESEFSDMEIDEGTLPF